MGWIDAGKSQEPMGKRDPFSPFPVGPSLFPKKSERYPLKYSKPLIVVLLLLLAACGGEAEEAAADPEASVEVLDFRYVQVPGGARIVSGKVHNRTTEPISNAQIQIALYDSDNRLITTMSVLVRDIEPDHRKPFRQIVDIEDDVQGARVRGVLVL